MNGIWFFIVVIYESTTIKVKIKMGTRNLTIVINQNGEKKVSQYGQWDGYPSGVGIDVLAFLSNKELFEKFLNNLSKTRFLDVDGFDKDFIESYNKNAPQWSDEPDKRTEKQKDWFNNYITRDLASKVLINIANSEDKEIILKNAEEQDDDVWGWIEWCYLIDLQKNTLEVYTKKGSPIKVYSLIDLPSKETFLSDLEK
jgi:hypothetical protein